MPKSRGTGRKKMWVYKPDIEAMRRPTVRYECTECGAGKENGLSFNQRIRHEGIAKHQISAAKFKFWDPPKAPRQPPSMSLVFALRHSFVQVDDSMREAFKSDVKIIKDEYSEKMLQNRVPWFTQQLDNLQLIIQNGFCKTVLIQYGSMTTYIERVEKHWRYGAVTVYILTVKTNSGFLPGAVLFARSPSTSGFRSLLRQLKTHCPDWHPRYMVPFETFGEFSREELEVWRELFPASSVIQSTENVKKHWYKKIHGDSRGPEKKTFRLVSAVLHAATKPEFVDREEELLEQGDPGFVKYYEDQYQSRKEMWALSYRETQREFAHSSKEIEKLHDRILTAPKQTGWPSERFAIRDTIKGILREFEVLKREFGKENKENMENKEGKKNNQSVSSKTSCPFSFF